MMIVRESKMSDKSNQNISELMDGELSRDCSRFLLKRMQSDDELRSSWNNYHMLRSCLQKEHSAPLLEDLGSSVVKQLNKSDKDHRVDEKAPKGFLKALSGVAIAASVALVAVFSFNNLNQIEAPANNMVFAKTSKQLINPPNANVVRVEQPIGYSRYPSLTPQVQQYIYDSNTNLTIPVYYNTDYVNSVIIQNQLKNKQLPADE